MKMYSKLLRGSAIFCATLLVCYSSNVSASTNNVVVPVSLEETTSTNLLIAPPPTLQIVSIIPFTFSGGTHIRCFGQNSGQATAEVTGGVAPYTYQWSGLPNQTGPTALGMYAGTYTLTVTDAAGSSVSESVTLIENPPLEGIATVSPILCNGGVATINLSAVGGTMPYYGLIPYQVTAGTYYLNVADANGCRSTVMTTITEPPVFQATATIVAPILCNGDAATVGVEGNGGVAPYNATGNYNENAGISNFIITDANGCYAYTSITINEPPVLETVIDYTPIECRGGNSEVTVSGLGGMPPYVGTGGSMQVAGSYQFDISDANGCQSSASVVITQPTALVATISSTPIACQGGSSTVEVTASGGTAPYMGPGLFIEQTGFHTYNVMDANRCSVDIATIVLEPTAMLLDISWVPIMNPGGTTDVEVIASGGTPGYTGVGLVNVPEGIHNFTVNDANGCTITQTINILAPDPGAMNLAGTNLSQNDLMKSNVINAENNSFVQAAFNTSSEEVEISYRLEYDSKVSIEIYDMTGALVEVIQEDMAIEGENYSVSIQPGKLTTGVYIYQFVTDVERQIDKLQIIR